MATYKNQSVSGAFAIANSFHSPGELLTSGELSRRANLPRGTGHRLIEALLELGVVERDQSGRYRQGMLLVPVSHIIDPIIMRAGPQQ